MTVARFAASGRFRLESIFRPESVAVLGAGEPLGARVMRNLLRGQFRGPVLPVQPGVVAVNGVLAHADIASLPVVPDLAVLCGPEWSNEATFRALAARGTFATVMVALSDAPRGRMRALAELTGVRSYGPGSFGVAVPAIGLDATVGHLPPRPGRVALVSQSASLCRAVLDWAAPNGIGFSHIVGVGANDDLGFGLVLDWLSRDAGTGAILLDIRRLKSPRMFLSAARAAARLRPVVALRPGGRLLDPSGTSDATLAAALNRAGVLSVDRLEDLLAAAETLTRAKRASGERLAIVSNALGPARLAADAVLRDGLSLAASAIDLVPTAALAKAAAAAEQHADGVMVLHAPDDDGEADAAISAVAAVAGTLRHPTIVCAMGEQTGAVHRRVLFAAGVPTFAEPETAVRAFLHLVQDRRNRAAARELPPRAVLSVAPDRAGVRAIVASASEAASMTAGAALLAAFGIEAAHPAFAGRLLIRTSVDPVFGPRIALGPFFAEAGPDVVVDLPPLNLALAHAMTQRSAAAMALGAEAVDILADRLVRVSALLVEVPDVASLSLDPFAPASATLALHPPGAAMPPLALPPYPSELVECVEVRGETLTIRPIRPEDADAHAAFFRHLTADDIRYRFFRALRELPPEEITRMTQIDFDREMAFVAVREETGETLGVARLVCETLSREGEFAVVVRPDVKGRGLASLLMRRLIAWGRSQGVTAIAGQVLADNRPMLTFVRHLGFAVHPLKDDPEVVEARLAL